MSEPTWNGRNKVQLKALADAGLCQHCGTNKVPVKGAHICNYCASPDWTRGCETCNEKPVVRITGMCGPCTFGEADTAGGNW